jgi:hypothetical protein
MNRSAQHGVVLANSESGSAFLHRLLTGAVQRFPSLAGAELPTAGAAFKRSFGDAVARFEAARLASPERLAIAQALHDELLASVHFAREGVERPLSEVLAEPVAAPKVNRHAGRADARMVPEVPLDGRLFVGRDVLAAVERLQAEHHLTDAAARALRWVVERAADGLDLSGERFVLLGASAELSPLSFLLRAGATVRCLDLKPTGVGEGGVAITSEGGDDLLLNPQAAVAAVREFAAEGPVHVGLFAYAPGASRELRLAAAMDVMVRALGPAVVKSVVTFISPTTPGEVQPEDVAFAAGRGRAPAWWQRGCEAVGALKTPGHVGAAHATVARGVISLQGAGYQAAQYLAKLISAEVLAAQGLGGRPITVSANVAGITNTRSLAHPLFQAGFVGAPAFGVRIFEPATTRALATLLMLHDLLNPEAPGHAASATLPGLARVKGIRSEQLHGGVYAMPWQFESAVRTAAVMGLARRPGLLLGGGRRA